MTTTNKIMAALVLLPVLAGCGKHSQVRDDATKEYMASKPEIYGEVGEPARQSKNTYPTNPDAPARSAVLKEKLFSNQEVGTQEVDTTAALLKQAE
jgi:GDP-D-mannose dehydratase